MRLTIDFLQQILLGHAGGSFPHNKTPFEYLYTEEGFNSAKSYFNSIAQDASYFNENQFVIFLRKLTDFNDHEILELYDTFGTLQIPHLVVIPTYCQVSLLVLTSNNNTMLKMPDWQNQTVVFTSRSFSSLCLFSRLETMAK